MRNIFFLIFAIAFASCEYTENNNSDSQTKYKLVESGIKRFPLDNRTSYQTTFVKEYQDTTGKEFLVFLGRQKPSIMFFDEESTQLVKEIHLKREGPNGVGSPRGLLVCSFDSIYIISSSQYKVALIDEDANVLNTYRVLDGDTYNENTGILSSTTASPPVKIKNTLYFNLAPDRNPFNLKFTKAFVNLKLNLQNGEFEYFNHFPVELQDKIWGTAVLNYSTTFNENTNSFISSFVSDSISVYNPFTKGIKRYYAGSRHSRKKNMPMTTSEAEIYDQMDDSEFLMQLTLYPTISYDKYRDVYYRFVAHSYPYKDDSGEINNYRKKQLSIIILDSDFQIVGETFLEKNIYLSNLFFLSSNGLYISRNNPNNPELSEDFIEFTLFKLADD